MTLPKHTILAVLQRGLESGDITVADVKRLLPKEKKRQRKVSPEVRDAVRRESDRHQLARDGLRFSVQPRDPKGYHLYLLNKTCLTVGQRLGVHFEGLDDLPRAADRVIENYLAQLAE